MTQIRTYGRYPTIGEMKAYYNRDDVLDFLYAACRLRNVHATFHDDKLPLKPTSKVHLLKLINEIIKHKIETGYQHDDEPGYILRTPIEVIRDVNNYEPVDEPSTPGHTVLWHGTSEAGADSILKRGFSAHWTHRRKVWFTTQFQFAAGVSQARKQHGKGAVVRFEFDLDNCPAIKQVKSTIYTFETSYLAFHSATATTTKFDLIFEADLRGWRASFEALAGAIQMLDDFDVCYRIKYSGVRSLHLMIPFEALPKEFDGEPILAQREKIYNKILDYFRQHCGVGKIDNPYVLRLAYTLNEDSGMVSTPIAPNHLAHFRPWEANLHNVTTNQPWHGEVPADAWRNTARFLEEVCREEPEWAWKRDSEGMRRQVDLGISQDTQHATRNTQYAPRFTFHEATEQLKSADERMRIEAAWHLLTAQAPVPTKILELGLSDENADVRWYLTEALQKHLDTQAIRLACLRLADSDAFVRTAAADALVVAPQNDVSSLNALWDAVTDEDTLLANLKPLSTLIPAIERICKLLSGNDLDAFVDAGFKKIGAALDIAIETGVSFHQFKPYMQLLRKLCEPHRISAHPAFEDTRKALAMQVLRCLGEKKAHPNTVLILRQFWKKDAALIETMRDFASTLSVTKDELPPSRMTASEQRAFQAITDVTRKQMAHILSAFLRYSSPQLFEPLTKLLSRIGRAELIEAMAEVATYRNDREKEAIPEPSKIRSVAMRRLGEIGDERAVPVLIEGLKSDRKSILKNAITGLMKLGRPAIPHLLEAFNANDVQFSRSVTKILGSIGDESAVPALIEALQSTQMEVEVYHSVVEALGVIRAPQAVPILIETLNHKRHVLSRAAADGLKRIGTDEALQAVEDFNRKRNRRTTDIVVENGTSPRERTDGMVLIPSGEFQMGRADGAPSQLPIHTVAVSAFYMDANLVTVAEYREFVEATGYHEPYWTEIKARSLTDDYPMNSVTWYDAMAYARWVGKRLPTEAEWEYAARGGLEGKAFPWGDEPHPNFANFNRKTGHPAPVGSYPPNGYGLYDMLGNIREWCLDAYYEDFYARSPAADPLATDAGDVIDGVLAGVKSPRVIRSSGLWDMSLNAHISNRSHARPRKRTTLIGFRCVLPVHAI